MKNQVIILFLALCYLTFCQCTVLFEDKFLSCDSFDPSKNTSNWGWYIPMSFTQRVKQVELQANPVKRVVDYQYPFGYNHFSYGAWYIKKYPILQVGKNQVLKVTVDASFKLFGGRSHPFGSAVSRPDDDPRLGTCGFLLKDPTSETALCMFNSNRYAWAWHDRFAYPSASKLNATGDPILPDFKGFVSWKNHMKRKVGEFDKMSIEYDRKKGTAKWLLNGEVIRSTSTIGKYPQTDGTDVTLFAHTQNATTSTVDIENFAFMFACVVEPDKVDYFNPGEKGLFNHNTPDYIYNLPSQWVSNNANSANDLKYTEFGQSVVFKMKNVKVELNASN